MPPPEGTPPPSSSPPTAATRPRRTSTPSFTSPAMYLEPRPTEGAPPSSSPPDGTPQPAVFLGMEKDLRATETHTGIGTGTMKTDCWKDLLDWNDFPPAAVSITTPPLPARYPPFPRDEEDPHEDLPDTGDVISSRDKTVVQDVARSVVTVVYHYKDDEDIMRQRLFTGFVIDRGGTQKHFRVFTCCTAIRSSDPEPKLQIRLIDMSVLEAKLLFFDAHYDVALLEILQESHLLEVSSFGAKPSYGQEVFVVGRDIESKLIAKRGSIEWLEETDYLGRHCHLFLSCEFSWYGRGGPVTDLDGCVIGMILETDRQNPPMLAMSTIATFMRMWMDYSFITRPMHGLRLRTVELLDVSLRENLSVIHKINNGYFVDEVSVSSTAESLGITSGEVIISIDNHPCYTLPKFENFLLFRGVDSLQTADSSLRCMVCVKLEVYNRVGHKTRAINLPVGFSVS